VDEKSIDWKLDEEHSSDKTCLLKWRHLRMRVSIKGSVMIYSVPVKDRMRFPDLAQLHDSMEQVMSLVLGHFGERYEGEVPT